MLKQHLAVPVLRVHYTHYVHVRFVARVLYPHIHVHVHVHVYIYCSGRRPHHQEGGCDSQGESWSSRYHSSKCITYTCIYMYMYMYVQYMVYPFTCTMYMDVCKWRVNCCHRSLPQHTHARTHAHTHARTHTQRQMREYLIRLIYCEMLGHECSWGYIHAVKFTQSTGILDKRIGKALAEYYMFRHTCVHVHVYVHTSVYIKLSILAVLDR